MNEEQLARLIRDAVREAMGSVTVVLDGEAVGRLVAPTVDSEIGKTAWAGRYDR